MRFIALDSWRGIAAILVVLFHLSAAGLFYDFPPIRHGALSVPFFFVLSGFVISHAYDKRLTTFYQFKEFIYRRFGRIYPLHFATLTVLFLLEIVKLLVYEHGIRGGQLPFEGSNSVSSLAANILLLQSILPFGDYTWNGPSWSISTEFYTYIFFGLMVFISGAGRISAAVGFVVVFGSILFYVESLGVEFKETQGVGLLLCLIGFLTGYILYTVSKRIPTKPSRFSTAYEIISLMMVIVVYYYGYSNFVVPMIVFAINIYVFSQEHGLISRLLKTRVFAFLGNISYSLYLVHFVVISFLGAFLRLLQILLHVSIYKPVGNDFLIDFGPPGSMDLLAVIYVLTVIGLATLTYRHIEEPGRRFFNKLAADRAHRDNEDANLSSLPVTNDGG